MYLLDYFGAYFGDLYPYEGPAFQGKVTNLSLATLPEPPTFMLLAVTLVWLGIRRRGD